MEAVARVHVEPTSLSIQHSGVGHVTGVIYVSVDGFAFPEDVWDDFAVIVAGWWLSHLADYQFRVKDTVELLFMEGPYRLRLSRGDGSSTQMEMVEDLARGEKIDLSATIDVAQFFTSLNNAVGVLIDFCSKQQRAIPDYPELIQARQLALAAFCMLR